VLLGILKRNIVFSETSLALSVLQEYKSDLPNQTSSKTDINQKLKKIVQNMISGRKITIVREIKDRTMN
jgi:hypothetical protein